MSFDYTGSFSGSFSGDLTASNGVISSSAQVATNLPSGVVSSSAQVSYAQVVNKPTTISAFQKNSIIANNRFRENTYPADSASFDSRIGELGGRITTLENATDETGSDSQTLSFNQVSNELTISDGNSVNLSTLAGGGAGGGSSIWSTGSDYYYVSSDLQVTGSFKVTENIIADSFTGSLQGTADTASFISDTFISASAARSGFGQGGGETYTEGLGIDITSEVISLDTSSAHFRLGVSASAAFYGFGGGGSFGDPPVIDQDGLQLAEYTTSGSVVGTLTVTDPTPGDTATWETQSAYTADFFRISSGGVVTLNTLASASMNTTAGSGSNDAHPFLVKVTDGQNNIVEGTIYIYVVPNTAPVFRQTSIGGSVITSFTSSTVNENSTDGSTIATIYFTDVNSDTITIRTGSVSPSDHFNYTINSTNVVITQDTASLDYESITSYTLSLTASDEHYENGDDLDSVTTLEIQIPVGDNQPPVVNDQTLTAINENTSNGAVVDSVEASDNEDDTITWTTFALRSAYLDGDGTNVTASLGGTSLYDPHANPFQLNSGNGQVTRKNGVFLNADVADRYEYEVEVKDIYNTISGSGIITIPITDDAQSTVADNWTNVYVIESAVDGDELKISSNGRTGTSAIWSSAVSQMWEVSSDGDLVEVSQLTGSATTLQLKNNLSGSAYSFDGTNTINVALTASETGFETTKQYIDLVVNVAINNAPDITFTNTSANLNTNGGRSGSLLTTISFTDTESDGLNHDTFTFTDPSGQLNAVKSGDDYLVQPINNLSASSYGFTASIQDTHGFRTNTELHSITIAQAGVGTLTENGTFYVIESATNGDNIVLGTNGRSGTQGDLGVTYDPRYNSAAVQSFTSSNALISVASNGNLSVGTDISGSGNIDGDTITSNITWQDQFGNQGGPTQISINVTENFAPTAADSPNTNTWNENLGVDGALLATLTWSDTEGDSLDIDTFTLTGDDVASISSSYNGSNAFGIYSVGDRSAGTLSYTASIKDTHGFSTGTYEDLITIQPAQSGSLNVSSFYIIESALSGANITTDTDGIGSAATLGVTYSPNYGSQVAQNFNTDSSIVNVTSGGVLTIESDVSGSYTNGNNFTADIMWDDQYGNSATQSISVDVTDNNPATAGFVNESVEAPVSAGTKLVTITVSDDESDSPFSVTLSGEGADSMSLEPQNATSSSWFINASDSSMTEGVTLNYTASITDAYSETTTEYNRSFVVGDVPAAQPLVYVYDIDLSSTNYNNTLGYSSATNAVPSTISDATVYDGFGFADAIQANLGDESIAYTFGSPYTASLLASGSLSSLYDISESFGRMTKNSAHRVAIIIPSGSSLTDVPTTMGDGYTSNGYSVLEIAVDGGVIGGGLGTTESSYIHKITLDSALNGYDDYIIISSVNPVPGSVNILLDIRPDNSQP